MVVVVGTRVVAGLGGETCMGLISSLRQERAERSPQASPPLPSPS